jgi:hypothetical protein
MRAWRLVVVLLGVVALVSGEVTPEERDAAEGAPVGYGLMMDAGSTVRERASEKSERERERMSASERFCVCGVFERGHMFMQNVCIHVHMYVCTDFMLNDSGLECMYSCMYACECVRMCAWVCACMYVSMCVY